MPKEFKYDVVLLIESVRDRPCLWDKSLENYKDRVERRAAWEEIFSILDEGYEEMSPEMKRTTGELILNKWTNIRDTFVKTLKTRMGKPKKKYLLHEHLKFLTKITPEEHCNLDVYNSDVPISYFKIEKEEIVKPSYSRKRNKQQDENEAILPKKSSVFDASNEIDFVGVDETNDPRVMNEDEAFFASLLPTVVKYNEDERLEFRMEVLAVMKNIKDKRKCSEDN
ncbi:hypothetical protein RR46_01282 [Papilio xuthus]|uniref:MADF domain-containing protein n=1 Tax=Papilio xuthus TaxID=66420 RepID=A0A0N1ICP7_PAPXU|nr:hypothetical protein RR46_01282 [Papilio xuthus]